MMMSTISSLLKTQTEITGLYTTDKTVVYNNNNNNHKHDLLQLYRNITNTLAQLQKMRGKDFLENDTTVPYYNDNSNAW